MGYDVSPEDISTDQTLAAFEESYQNAIENSAKDGIVKIKNDELENGLPMEWDAYSIVDKTDETGKTLQRRIYGENGMAIMDFDTSDHGLSKAHPTGAHKHIFDYSKK